MAISRIGGADMFVAGCMQMGDYPRKAPRGSCARTVVLMRRRVNFQNYRRDPVFSWNDNSTKFHPDIEQIRHLVSFMRCTGET